MMEESQEVSTDLFRFPHERCLHGNYRGVLELHAIALLVATCDNARISYPLAIAKFSVARRRGSERGQRPLE